LGGKEGLWQYKSRTDQLVVFSHGEHLYAADIEDAIKCNPPVKDPL
jgi:hypothetical protein